ncbi:MAG: hypothetical protein P8175_13905, partial [Deltaproteobacteria bacterium]
VARATRAAERIGQDGPAGQGSGDPWIGRSQAQTKLPSSPSVSGKPSSIQPLLASPVKGEEFGRLLECLPRERNAMAAKMDAPETI